MSARQKCKFCSDYKWQVLHDKKFTDDAVNDPECSFDFRHKYEVALVTITRRRQKGDKSQFKDGGQYTQHGYPLHFCPVCGRKIR